MAWSDAGQHRLCHHILWWHRHDILLIRIKTKHLGPHTLSTSKRGSRGGQCLRMVVPGGPWWSWYCRHQTQRQHRGVEGKAISQEQNVASAKGLCSESNSLPNKGKPFGWEQSHSRKDCYPDQRTKGRLRMIPTAKTPKSEWWRPLTAEVPWARGYTGSY